MAIALLGKILCREFNGEKIRLPIIETEAYCKDETICYGHGKSKQEVKEQKRALLFEKPGTLCIYGGLLLISAYKEDSPDNILIRSCEGYIGPHKLANIMKLYQKFTNGKDIISGGNAFIKDKLWIEEDFNNPIINYEIKPRELKSNKSISEKDRNAKRRYFLT